MKTRAGSVLTLVLALAACDGLSPAEKQTVQRWLLCEECVDGELDAVVALGDHGVKALGNALKGPPSDRRENIRRQAMAMYDRSGTTGITRQEYVDHYVSNYVATYQSRATVSLVQINTPRAHAALVNALRNGTLYRDDVLRLLGESVRAIDSIVAGENQQAPVDSFVRVNPSIVVLDSTNGQPLSNVRVVFRVDSGGGKVVDSVQFTDAHGRAAVRWRLGSATADSINVLHAAVAGRTARFHAVAHPWGPRVVFLVQPSNATVGHPISPAVRIAVQDAWGDPQPNFNGSAELRVVATPIMIVQVMAAGEAVFSGLIVTTPGTGFRLRAAILGVAPAFSDPFDVGP